MNLLTRHFVRPEHTNHHTSLYAGQYTEWLVEASFVAMVKVMGTSEGFVMVSLDSVKLSKSLYPGNVLEVWEVAVSYGSTSVVISLLGKDMATGKTCCEAKAVYVTVDEDGKKIPHGRHA